MCPTTLVRGPYPLAARWACAACTLSTGRTIASVTGNDLGDHARDAASVFRLAWEKGPAGSYWHAVADGAIRSATLPRPSAADSACPS